MRACVRATCCIFARITRRCVGWCARARVFVVLSSLDGKTAADVAALLFTACHGSMVAGAHRDEMRDGCWALCMFFWHLRRGLCTKVYILLFARRCRALAYVAQNNELLLHTRAHAHRHRALRYVVVVVVVVVPRNAFNAKSVLLQTNSKCLYSRRAHKCANAHAHSIVVFRVSVCVPTHAGTTYLLTNLDRLCH